MPISSVQNRLQGNLPEALPGTPQLKPPEKELKKKTRVEQIRDTILNHPKTSLAAAVLGSALTYAAVQSFFTTSPCTIFEDPSKCSPEAAYANFKSNDPQSAFFLAQRCLDTNTMECQRVVSQYIDDHPHLPRFFNGDEQFLVASLAKKCVEKDINPACQRVIPKLFHALWQQKPALWSTAEKRWALIEIAKPCQSRPTPGCQEVTRLIEKGLPEDVQADLSQYITSSAFPPEDSIKDYFKQLLTANRV